MLQQPGAVAQRFADEPEMESLQIADAAMDHLRRGRRSLRAAAALLEQRDVVAAPRQFPRDPRAVDSAADDRKPHGAIVSFFMRCKAGLRAFGARFETAEAKWRWNSYSRAKIRALKPAAISPSCSPAAAPAPRIRSA